MFLGAYSFAHSGMQAGPFGDLSTKRRSSMTEDRQCAFFLLENGIMMLVHVDDILVTERHQYVFNLMDELGQEADLNRVALLTKACQ